jgi:hypothetical protein
MKRLIFLKIDNLYLDNAKLNKSEIKILEEKVQKEAVETFKTELKKASQMSKVVAAMKIVKELSDAQVIMEFNDEHLDVAYEFLRKLDIVEIIDSVLPSGS